MRRAESVRQALIKKFGVDSLQVLSKGYGEAELIKSNERISNAKTKQEKEEFHTINRRIQLKVVGKK
ncbi:MAG: hypothetical protein H0W73_11010 [Bacteroidetes bacterium]|nr:hypothetical protein [Bacteroidota bacterium]